MHLCRGVVERAFNNDWKFKILGSRSAIPHQHLEACNFGPNPNVSNIYIVATVLVALLEKYGKRYHQIHHLQGNILILSYIAMQSINFE